MQLPTTSWSALDAPDYADVFSHRSDVDTTAEHWARVMFGNTPGLLGTLLFRGLLGLRITHRRSRDTIGGWRVAARTDEAVRLEARSWFLTGELVVLAAAGSVTLVTSMRYDRRLAAIVWPAIAVVHRRVAPGLLRDAATAIAQKNR
ncbi:DUF2867 domain-containing protein [Mumia sp. zg.B53]|uniref:DUF2867 domain-containing protein n=1 Tax=unclassified Mumia TaxID=2621872 RepID=UPI001C6ED403|nr:MULTISPECIES: DUF2867 domain-containing protein [unclassified Mumia]MBW9210719.1 DUF2867 domain-containing protein [Mumia sp. zg.B21]MBW9215333.1 DUF2867 domain-containing protein [Mumia sp. zg.B53]